MLVLSEGGGTGILSELLSGIAGVTTGIGKSIERRCSMGMGMLRDSFRGLTG
jgi:hypothetical protein